mgnify:CR=1 FL=1
MQLPEFDIRTKPPVRREWFALMPHRSQGFWWRVGCVVKAKRVRHGDHETIKQICEAVDAAHPEHRRHPCWYQPVYFVLR